MTGVAALVAALEGHTPATAAEEASRRRTLAFLHWLPRPFDETADPTHVTGSAIVVDAGGHVLLHRHKRLGIWLQPGGHLDPGEDPAAAAVRETAEETGLTARHPEGGPHLLHIDVHPGPRGHLHLDARYLLHASGDAAFAPAVGESPDIAWFIPDEAQRVGDRSLAEAVAAARRTLADAAGDRVP